MYDQFGHAAFDGSGAAGGAMVALIAEMEAVLTSMQDRTVHSMNIILKEMAIWTIS